MSARGWLLVPLSLVACGEESGRFFPPDDDGASQTDATLDALSPSDLGSQDLVSQDRAEAATDRGSPVDRGVNRCPSGCASSRDCLPCAERAGELYCCVSGLCVFSSEPTCAAKPDGGGGGPDGSDGGDGAAPDTSSNPFDDVGDPGDGGAMPPEDVTETDGGIDGGGATDAASDAVNDLARADAGG